MKFTLPTIVSCVRIVLAPLVYALIVSDNPQAAPWAAIVFVLGALTDYADGWLARKRQEVTSFGVFFDPLADKILVSAAFLGFAETEILPLWPVLLMITRDIGTTLLRSYADDIGQPVVTSRSAKTKTFAQMAFVIWLLLLSWAAAAGFPFSSSAGMLLNSDITLWAIYIVALYTVWTGVEYLIANREVVRRFCMQDAREFTSEWLATGFGIGYAPFMPGTFGSLLALCVAILTQNHFIFLGLAIAVFFLGLWVIPSAERKFGNDSPQIIMDEAMGMWLVLALPSVPISVFWSILAFGLFRLFDILKPFPIRWANNKSGAFWVLADDLIAAAAAAIMLHLLYYSSMIFPLVVKFITR